MARLEAASLLSSGVVCDATTPVERIVPGSRAVVTLSCWNTGSAAVTVSTQVAVLGREGGAIPARRIEPGRVTSDTMSVAIPESAAPTQPYYLRRPLAGAMYVWPEESAAVWGEPAGPGPVSARFDLGDGISQTREVVYRTVEQAVGEVRRPLFVVPRVEVRAAPTAGLWPVGRTTPHGFTVTLRHHATDTTTGMVTLEVPAGWPAPAPRPFTLRGPNAEATLRFAVRSAAGASSQRYLLRAVARDAAGREYSSGADRVEYPHIRPRQLVTASTMTVAIADIRLPPDGAIAYVRGAADRIPEALAALGVRVTLIAADSLVGPALARFRTVLIGPRAWETEPTLSEQNDRLMAWVRDGGTLIVQYQQFQYLRGGYAPFDLSLAETPGGPLPQRVAAPRVAEEDARVTVLEPAHPVFRAPNQIGARDWEGWVQERGLYFPRSWGAEWTPLVEMSDAGEPAQRGALLVARCGRGTYVYTGLSFFRQLPAAVPGATRLFLNLLALGRQGG